MTQKNKKENSISNILYSVISALFLSIGSNNIYAEEIGTEVENGTIKINSKGISYEYNGIGKTEIKGWNEKHNKWINLFNYPKKH